MPGEALAEDTRFELVRGCPQHAFQVFVWGTGMCGRGLTCGAVHLGRDSERFRTSVNATRTATTADLLAGFRAEPLEGLPGPCGDALEVVIAMELGKPLQLSGRGDDQVDSSGTSVFPEIDVAVAARYYPSLYVHLLHS